MKIRGIDFPCAQRGEPELLDGGTYDNTGLEALNGERYRDVFLISINAGGVFEHAQATRAAAGPVR